MRYVIGVLLLGAAGALAAFVVAGRAPAPVVEIVKPTGAVGLEATLDVTVEVPGSRLSRLDVTLEQSGRTTPLFSLQSPGQAVLRQETADRVRISRPIGKHAVPELTAGPARIVVAAARTTLFGLRTRAAVAAKPVTIHLTPPSLAVVSAHHHVSLGGAEAVVYTVSPPEATSGVKVGEHFYPGYPASAAGATAGSPALRFAFFALLDDQDLGTPILLTASDEAGNRAQVDLDHKVLSRPFRKGRIELSDAFLGRVVPGILQRSPELSIAVSPGGDLLPAFLRINNDLRRANDERIRALAPSTAPRLLWNEPFVALANAKVESRFGDRRTYDHKGQEVDRQVHLGVDLAVTRNIPIPASNAGTVVFADHLGIYGNCVVIDHGLGVQSLYGHLASIETKVGDTVARGQRLGVSGMTGLAGGDHLHFAILLQGRPVNPVEWWDAHWLEDRVWRKLREAGATAAK